MKITVITLFPEMIKAFCSESIVKRAQDKGLVEIEIVNLRDFAVDSYGSVDDRPYGGGAGMVLRADVVGKAIAKVKNQKSKIKSLNSEKNNNNESMEQCSNEKIVITSARGKVYSQRMAQEYAKLEHLIILAGHYEGFDERVHEMGDEEVSIGDYVLTGGEIPAAVILDSVVRLLPGVLKKEEATVNESFFKISINQLIKMLGEDDVLMNLKSRGQTEVMLLEYPQYTRPETFEDKKVPTVLLSGNHAEIEKWKLQKAYEYTKKNRPDLLEKVM